MDQQGRKVPQEKESNGFDGMEKGKKKKKTRRESYRGNREREKNPKKKRVK